MTQTATLSYRLFSTVQRYQGLAGLALLFMVAFFISGDTFFTHQNVKSVLNQVAIPGALALGMTFVILTGGIDLSVGSHLALLNCVLATWGKSGASLGLAGSYVLLLGGLIGALIGAAVSYTKLQPFVVTLAAMVSLRGITFIYTNNANISGIGDFLAVFQEHWFGLPVPAWILLSATALGAVVLRKTVFGRYVYAIGGNEEAARLSGVPVTRVRIGAYAVNGLCIALAAILFTARTNNGQPSTGLGYELDAIAAVVVGGASLLGGYGNVFGTLIGALFIVCMNVLLVLKGINYHVGMGWRGLIILTAVYLQNLGRK